MTDPAASNMQDTPHGPQGHVAPLALLQPGQRIGPFELLQLIERGRAATIFQARDHVVGRVVRFEQLHPTSELAPQATLQAIERYLTPYKKAAATNPRLQQHGQAAYDETAGVYLVQEWTEGKSFAQLIELGKTELGKTESGKAEPGHAEGGGEFPNGVPNGVLNDSQNDALSERTVLGVIASSALALHTLHENGLVHGCLTPQRIVLLGASGLKLIQAGVPSIVDLQHVLQPSVVPYVAPELIAGQPPSPRSDLYALGMIAYQALAGQQGYKEAFKTVLRDERNQAMRWAKWQSNIRLQPPALNTLNPEVSEHTSQLIARLIDKSSTARINNTGELIQVIQRYLEADSKQETATQSNPAATHPSVQPGSASPPVSIQAAVASAPNTATIPQNKRKWQWIVASVLVWIIAFGAVGYTYLHKKQTQYRALRNSTMDLIGSAVSAINQDDPTSAMVYATSAVEITEQTPGLHNTAQAWKKLAEGNLADHNGLYEDARVAYAQAIALNGIQQPKWQHALNDRLAQAITNAAFANGIAQINQAIDEGRFNEAQALVDDWRPLILNDQEAQILSDTQTRLFEHIDFGDLNDLLKRAEDWLATGRRDEAIALLKRRVDRGDQSPALISRYQSLTQQAGFDQSMQQARQAASQENYTQALGYYDQALAHRPQDPTATSERTYALSRSQLHQARLALNTQNTDLAQTHLRQALTTDPNFAEARRLLDQITSDTQLAQLVNQAALFAQQAQWDRAITAYDQALTVAANANNTTQQRQIQALRTDAQVNQSLTQAELALANQNTTQAQADYQNALKLNANHPRVVAFAQTLNTHQQHDQFVQRGEQSFEEGQYGQATVAFLKARDLIETERINHLIDESRYQNLLKQVRQFIHAQNARDANAMLAALKAHRPDAAEISELTQAIANITN